MVHFFSFLNFAFFSKYMPNKVKNTFFSPKLLFFGPFFTYFEKKYKFQKTKKMHHMKLCLEIAKK